VTVGVIGLGNMGAELANNLVQAGFDVVTHDVAGPTRNPAGAAFVESPAAVAERAEAVVLSLPNGAISAEVAAALAAAPDRAVTVVIDTSTIGPDAARSIAAALAEAGVGYVDAPVSGGAAGARARTLTVMYSGTPDAAAAASAVIEGLSDRRFHVGDAAGLAQAVKLANNFLSATALAATSEAVAFATAAGVDLSTLLTVLNASSGSSAASQDKFVNHVLPGTYASGFLNTLMAKDVALYTEAVAAVGTPATVAGLTQAIWRGFADTEPGVDFTRIYPHIANP